MPTLRNHVRASLQSVNKGWFNLQEPDYEIYLQSKLKKLMELIKFCMQVCVNMCVRIRVCDCVCDSVCVYVLNCVHTLKQQIKVRDSKRCPIILGHTEDTGTRLPTSVL